jgi:hypothetical protein
VKTKTIKFAMHITEGDREADIVRDPDTNAVSITGEMFPSELKLVALVLDGIKDLEKQSIVYASREDTK